MTRLTDVRRPDPLLWWVQCIWCLAAVGCVDHTTSASLPRAISSSASQSAAGDIDVQAPQASGDLVDDIVSTPAAPDSTVEAQPDAAEDANAGRPAVPGAVAPIIRDRVFAAEAPHGALRVGFDDLDLLKLLRMEPVTPDCVDKMPGWLRNLNGKTVRIRGFMKPGLVISGIPQFLFVRDTGLCCFGPKGKIYDMIAVTLKPGTTTEYIELKPFDVVGTFRIEILALDDGMLFGLYYLDDATIVQK
ncbi:MAG: hypothetical protein EXS05_24725 [Planctomycetaceae bacterium]|nr:hypothetical protein [Planctomycetaceae bacterium]